ncbi:MAG: glycosyltransferase family 2 protein [Bacteroidales bacterium]|nr:glycosyltransferase family 2 protein [Bacteroidales bacterium]
MDLTVAICMYNARKYIRETLSCILSQSVQDFHLLIVDDASTDDGAALVEEFFREHPRQYELQRLPENGGLCAGRRFVEEHASTKYLLFVDADDCPYPQMVEKLYGKIVSDPDLMAVGCYQEYMGTNGEKLRGGIYLGCKTKEEFYAKAAAGKLIFMSAGAAVFDRELALRVGGHQLDGFPEGKPRYRDLCEDLDLWCRMSDLFVEGKAIIVLPEVLWRYRKHERAMSTDSFGMTLRMKHIKGNLRRRRSGQKDLSFIEFRDNLPPAEEKAIRREAVAADSFRKAYFLLRKGRIFSALFHLLRSFFAQPSYGWKKVRANLHIFH